MSTTSINKQAYIKCQQGESNESKNLSTQIVNVPNFISCERVVRKVDLGNGITSIVP
jgi:hypothetical protein